jgi:protein O-GlcNAc transferase
VYLTLGRVLIDMRDYAAAAVRLARAVQIRADAVNCRDLAMALLRLGRLEDAEKSAQAAIAIGPETSGLYMLLAEIQMAGVGVQRAVAAAEKAVELDPASGPPMELLGMAQLAAGHAEAGIATLERAIDLSADLLGGKSALLFARNYDPTWSGEDLARKASALMRPVEAKNPARRRHANLVDPQRRLRVGFISAELKNAPVARFLMTMLPALDRQRLELFAYSVSEPEDDYSRQLRTSFASWRQVRSHSDAEIERLILDDQIDVLVDLQGHTGRPRCSVLAAKPAPVSFVWLGYSGTTGLTAIDYVLGDRLVTPPGSDAQFSETIWRMPDSYLCFSPPNDAPPVAPLPALKHGYVTFGSFNNTMKLSDPTLALWARLLAAVPNSRLLLKNRFLDQAEVAAKVGKTLAAAGADLGRVDLVGHFDDQAGHLGAYGRIDIALDPFPYNGTTTSCEALWMGVPTLTVAGDRFLSRVGESLLNTVGLPDWVAADGDDFVAKAVRMSSDVARLAELRQSLRGRMAASPLCDAPRFAENFEAALRSMWAKWCERQLVA